MDFIKAILYYIYYIYWGFIDKEYDAPRSVQTDTDKALYFLIHGLYLMCMVALTIALFNWIIGLF